MTRSIVSTTSPYGEPNSEHRRRLMGKHSKDDGRGKGRRIVAAGVLIFAVAAAIALGAFDHTPADTIAGGGGGGNTGNRFIVE
jgi:hypothetical protein